MSTGALPLKVNQVGYVGMTSEMLEKPRKSKYALATVSSQSSPALSMRHLGRIGVSMSVSSFGRPPLILKPSFGVSSGCPGFGLGLLSGL